MVLNFYIFYTNSFEILVEVVVLVKEDVIFVDEDGFGLLQLSFWQHVTFNGIDEPNWEINSHESRQPWKSIFMAFVVPVMSFNKNKMKVQI